MVGHPVLDVAGADTDDGTLARPVEGDGMKYALMYRLGLTPWEHYAEVAQASIAEKLTRESADRSNRPLGRALDVGCGRGVHSAALARMGWDVVGIDMVPRAVEAANRTGLQGVRLLFVLFLFLLLLLQPPAYLLHQFQTQHGADAQQRHRQSDLMPHGPTSCVL